MSTFTMLQTLFVSDLHELHRLQKRGWLVFPMARVVKEEHLGRCCYLAEEFLATSDLSDLKHALGINDRQWRAYKARVSGQ